MQQASPPLQTYFGQLEDKTCSILIPGCGNAYEADWLQQRGFSSITLVDISDLLMASLREKYRNNPALRTTSGPAPGIHLITGDFFGLSGQYDLIVEQTFFCALDPSLRTRYVEKTHELLRPGGKLIGLLFDRSFVGGPPFGGHKAEYQKLLEKKFTIKALAPCYNSIPPRAGTELFLIAEKP